MLIGLSAIATEAALWYLGREQAYAAADAAALAGAIQYANDVYAGTIVSGSTDPAAADAATTVAGYNGFGPGAAANTVAGATSSTVSADPFSGGTAVYGASATEVTISVDFPAYLASLFHAADINVGVQSVAAIKTIGQACMLSLSGDLTIAMGVTGTYEIPCYFASNATDSSAVTVLNTPSLYTYGITTRGACKDCPSVDPLWGAPDWTQGSEDDRPTATYQVPTTNPFSSLPSSITYPSANQIQCPTPSTAPGMTYTNGQPALDPTSNCPLVPAAVSFSAATVPPTQPDPQITTVTSACGASVTNVCAYYNMDVTISGASVVQPGTYLMLNASLSIGPGATVTCSSLNYQNVNLCNKPSLTAVTGNTGVTFLFAGFSGASQPDAGALSIDPTASVKLSAAGVAAYPASTYNAPGSPLNGILFFRDPALLTRDSAAAPSVIIADNLSNASGPSVFNGVMYFPGANVWYAGNVSSDASAIPACAVIIAGTLNIGYLNNSGSSSNYISVNATCSGYNVSSGLIPAVQAASLVQ